jgi:hypothetical protein
MGEFTFLRAKPLRCRLHVHAWTVWSLQNDYARYEPVPGSEGLIALRYFLERRCQACGETDREYGVESRVSPDMAPITDYERKRLRRQPLERRKPWVIFPAGYVPPPMPFACRVGVHRWSTIQIGQRGCNGCGRLTPMP